MTTKTETVHLSHDSGETALCGQIPRPFAYAGDIDLVTCRDCESATRIKKLFVGADPHALQSVRVRLIDAAGRDTYDIACSTGAYEIEVKTDNGLEDGRETIHFEMVARRRV